MTIDRIYELTKKISQEMKIIGIPISGNINKITVNNRTRKRLGACLRELLPGGEQRFTIEISAKALGYHIKRMVNFEELGISAPKEAESIKYTAVCKMCGQQYPRKRMCPLIKNPGRYRCGKCGGRLKLL